MDYDTRYRYTLTLPQLKSYMVIPDETLSYINVLIIYFYIDRRMNKQVDFCKMFIRYMISNTFAHCSNNIQYDILIINDMNYLENISNNRITIEEARKLYKRVI